MKRTLSHELTAHIGSKVLLQGFLHASRPLGKITFLVLRDRTGLAQIILEGEQKDVLNGCHTGTILEVEGTVVNAPTSNFKVEIHEASVRIVRKVEAVSPVVISKESLDAELDTLLDNRVITLRHPHQSAIFKVASVVEKHLRDFLYAQEFVQINTPKIIAFPTEGGSEVFEVEYFDKKVYLAQSPQFYKQMMVPVFERVFEIGHSYRAEKSNTSRHMSEILMLDVEMGFISSLDDVLEIGEQLIKYAVHQTFIEQSELFELLDVDPPLLMNPIPRITVQELHALMLEHTGEDYTKELDVVPSEERFICAYAREHWSSDAVFVTEFPWSDAKFYHHQNRENPLVADRADLLFKGVEIATLTRREVNYNKLCEQISAKGASIDNPGLVHYLDAFKYGMPDSGGFGFGMARFVQKLLDLSNVKEAELFPRDVQRVTP